MSTITCVYWLQSGRLFAQVEEPDRGADSIGAEYVHPRPLNTAEMVEWDLDADSRRYRAVPLLTFCLTEDPQLVAAQYAVGRRRFHYRETSGWQTDYELMERDLLLHGGLARLARQRQLEQYAKDAALFAAGAFPDQRTPAEETLPGINPIEKLAGMQMVDMVNPELLKKVNPVLLNMMLKHLFPKSLDDLGDPT